MNGMAMCDRPDHALHDEEGVTLLRRFHAEHVPTVAVLLSGRPLWINRELTLADAAVAAWLPGSEGEGLADVLVGDAKGAPRFDFTGRLGFAWPGDCHARGAPLLREGQGGSYAAPPHLPALDLKCDVIGPAGTAGMLFARRLGDGVTAFARGGDGQPVLLPGLIGRTSDAAVVASGLDRHAQEDARRLVWQAPGAVRLETKAAGTVTRLTLTYAATGPVTLAPVCPGGTAQTLTPGAWHEATVATRCHGPLTALELSAATKVTFDLDRLAAAGRAAPPHTPRRHRAHQP